MEHEVENKIRSEKTSERKSEEKKSNERRRTKASGHFSKTREHKTIQMCCEETFKRRRRLRQFVNLGLDEPRSSDRTTVLQVQTSQHCIKQQRGGGVQPRAASVDFTARGPRCIQNVVIYCISP